MDPNRPATAQDFDELVTARAHVLAESAKTNVTPIEAFAYLNVGLNMLTALHFFADPSCVEALRIMLERGITQCVEETARMEKSS